MKGWSRRMEKRVPKLCWKRRGRGWTAGSGTRVWPSQSPRASCPELYCGRYWWDCGCAGMEGKGHRRPGSQFPLWALSLVFWCLSTLLRSPPCVLNTVTLTLNFRTACWGVVSSGLQMRNLRLRVSKSCPVLQGWGWLPGSCLWVASRGSKTRELQDWVTLQSSLSRAPCR